MLRAYQSPSSAADCGPQWAQIPNLASRNHSGTWYACSASRVPLKGPFSISGVLSCADDLRRRRRAGAPARTAITFRLLIVVGSLRAILDFSAICFSIHQIVRRSEEHTSELQSLRHLVC